MKIAALVSFVTAGRQARESQLTLENSRETIGVAQVFGYYKTKIPGNEDIEPELFLSYGCWCQIRNEAEIMTGGLVPGHGAPVDALDEACKAWRQCRACVAIDFSNDETCDTVYKGPSRYGQPLMCHNIKNTECTVSTFCNYGCTIK